jgi:hypothetical protein
MLIFFSHNEAGNHFSCDSRTAKKNFFNVKYIINRSAEFNPNSKFVFCKSCNKKCLISEARSGNCNSCKKKTKPKQNKYCKLCGIKSSTNNIVNNHLYCKSCSNKGLGRKNQGIIISQKYKGKNNPNYTNGKSVKNLWQDAKWTSLRKNYFNKVCAKCSSTKKIHLHHIIPQAFLKKEERYNLNNIIPLCELHHKELHHLQLDIVLLPILYQQYKKDVQELPQLFCSQPEFQSMSYEGDEKYYKLSLIRLLPKNYHKILLNLHPEFVQQEFPYLLN